MKLYLSSVGIPDKRAFRSLLPANRTPHIGVTANAWDVYPEEKSEPFINGRLQDLKDIGCAPTIINLRDFKDRPDGLRDALEQLSAIWVTGGNVFYLNWLMHKCGFNDIIKPLVDNGLVYGGESAGAVITGPSLHGAELMDDSSKAEQVIWDGLGLVDFSIVPHWGNPKYTDLLEGLKTEMSRHVETVKTLTDQDFIVVDDNLQGRA